MPKLRIASKPRVITLAFLAGLLGFTGAPAMSQTFSFDPARMPHIGTVDERYQSYNVEMLEVTGGRFWKPYSDLQIGEQKTPSHTATEPPQPDTPAGMDQALYQYRPPIDLTNPKLRKLAAALGPAYLRVSGTWANTTYLPESDQPPPKPPEGYSGVLTHNEWKGVIAFAKAVQAEIVTSFANGIGTRNAAGVWAPDEAKRFVDYTGAMGGQIVAAEFMNEPTLAAMGGAPSGYNAANYGRDFKIFHAFAKKTVPDMLILGPGSVGETTGDWGVAYGNTPILKTRDLLAASQPTQVDVFSYHHYGASSQRCAAMGKQTTAETALSEEWLRRTDETFAFYRGLRDEFDPGKPFWVTETADAACGGNPWAKTFLDSFRYLDQLGRLARQEVKAVFHNTLASSDYGLLDETTLEPRPNYWAALVWHRLMGSTVLDSGVQIREGLHLYAHCLRGVSGGVALLAMNNSRTEATSINLRFPAERYTLAADPLDTTQARLNGKQLRLGPDDALPDFFGERITGGPIELTPASITFLAVPAAANANCG